MKVCRSKKMSLFSQLPAAQLRVSRQASVSMTAQGAMKPPVPHTLHPPRGMSMAVTTAPKVLCTASPTFRAISVPPSSSACASVTSVDNEKGRAVVSQSFPKWETRGKRAAAL